MDEKLQGCDLDTQGSETFGRIYVKSVIIVGILICRKDYYSARTLYELNEKHLGQSPKICTRTVFSDTFLQCQQN